MSSHDRKQRNVRISNKSPIATPPRVALQGRSSRGEQSTDSQTPDSSPDPVLADTDASSNQESTINSGREPVDKDDKIAWLQKEMAVMDGEFSNALEQLGQKLANESEISLYWQQKYSTLNQQWLTTDADLRVLRHESASADKQREERGRDIQTRISSLMLDRDSTREAYHMIKLDSQRKDEEIMQLRSQVKGLKDFVSTSARTDGQVTDEVFGEMMQKLGNGLQNWVIQNFRKSKIDFTKTKDETREQLSVLVPTYEALAVTAKVHLFQSLISRLLVTHVFDKYFVGLPEDRAAELQKLEIYMGSIIGDKESMNQWRSSTLTTLKKASSEELERTTEMMISTLVDQISSILDDISDASISESRNQSLRALVKGAIDLSRLLRAQKAIFKPIMPNIEGHQINTFDTETMEDMGGEDEDTLEGREICCVTFPGITKEGDEHGGQTQLRNIIAKARVLCLPD